MRIWSLHPCYLDAIGLVALWRETLLAKHVLENKTRGYKNHPQLQRFKNAKQPLDAINQYLSGVLEEAIKRGYHFDASKISFFKSSRLAVTNGQMDFEVNHLLRKLKIRDRKKFKELREVDVIKPHPLFKIKEGAIESWEIV